MMNYIHYEKGCTAQELSIAQCPIPIPNDHEVLISVHYAGVNRPDILQRQGIYPAPPHHSAILGLEVSGIIIKIGKSVTQWSIGDQVMALTPGGGYAEYVCTLSSHCLPIPTSWTMIHAAGFCECYFTAWLNLIILGNIESHHSLLIHGGSSGVGLALLQISQLLNITTYTSVSSEKKAEICQKMGAYPFILKTEKNKSNILEILHKKYQVRSIDLIIDMISGVYTADNLRLLNRQGKLLIVGLMGGGLTNLQLGYILNKNLCVTGSTLRSSTDAIKTRIAKDLQEKLLMFSNHTSIYPVIDSLFDKENVSLSHQRMEQRKHVGKIILQIHK